MGDGIHSPVREQSPPVVGNHTWYDSEYAAKMTEALWTPSTPRTLTSIAAGLRQILDVEAGAKSEHIKSHSGHTLNELANIVCDVGGNGELTRSVIVRCLLIGWITRSLLAGHFRTLQDRTL